MDFWTHYGDWFGWLVLFGYLCFPRIMLFFVATTAPWQGGDWIFWLCVPSLLVAMKASEAYGNTNPNLVLAAWVIGVPKALVFAGTVINKIGDLFGYQSTPPLTVPAAERCGNFSDHIRGGCTKRKGHDGAYGNA